MANNKLFKEFYRIQASCYNIIMYKLYPYFTNDGSVGLFSPADDDIYHSTYGALTEAYEKFVLPMNLEKFFADSTNIKILDICFGIGYNSKSFFDFFLKNISSKNNNNAPIYSDNILRSKEQKINNKISIYIKAVDTDKTLAYLSPFFVTGKKLPKNYKLPFEEKRIEKLIHKHDVDNNKSKNKIKQNKPKQSASTDCKDENQKTTFDNKLSRITNIIFLKEIIKNSNTFLVDPEINQILTDKNYRNYFDKFMVNLFNFERNRRYIYTPLRRLNVFLHNIYYNHVSTSYKKALKCLKLNDFTFDLKIEDARVALQNDNNLYNYVFLDAFTPAKCPCLWTEDFFKLLYAHLDDNGMIFTYSNSAAVRNAFLNAGFYVGKIYNESAGKFMGTVACKNKSLIKFELSEYDLGLLKTKAGIVYRDENFNSTNEAIIESHKKAVETSNLISSSQYIKNTRRNANV